MFALEAAATDSTLDIAIMIFNPHKPYSDVAFCRIVWLYYL